MTAAAPPPPNAALADLAQHRRWVDWRTETRDCKPTNVPYSANGDRANIADPATWTGYHDAVAYHQAVQADGIGFVFGNGYADLGLDEGRDPHTGKIEPWAVPIVRGLDSCADPLLLTEQYTSLRMAFCRQVDGFTSQRVGQLVNAGRLPEPVRVRRAIVWAEDDLPAVRRALANQRTRSRNPRPRNLVQPA